MEVSQSAKLRPENVLVLYVTPSDASSVERQAIIIWAQTYNKRNFVGRNFRTEEMLTWNNMVKFFKKLICQDY